MSSPQNPETRGAWLWRKMMFVYGARFLDMWEGVDVNEMQITWSEALRGIPRDAIQRGIGALYRTRHPPTLPEFIDLCKPPAPVPVAHQFRLEESVERTDSATARAKLADIAARVAKPSPGIEWARRIVEAARTEHVPAMKLAMAQEAIRQWEIINAPRSREPGDDDEPDEVVQ
jgi:hypothetical protein